MPDPDPVFFSKVRIRVQVKPTRIRNPDKYHGSIQGRSQTIDLGPDIIEQTCEKNQKKITAQNKVTM